MISFLFLFSNCDIDNKDVTTFKILFVVGVFFLAAAWLMSFYMKVIKPKILIGMNYEILFCRRSSS